MKINPSGMINYDNGYIYLWLQKSVDFCGIS